jgi:acetylornithine deacetylase/succinyl-diaminopimelate desuccinylase-like protein
MITLGMKGLLYVELKCRIGRADMHSSRAALVQSASWRLVKALDTLRDLDGRIDIPGWSDGKLEPTEQDMELIGKIPFDEEAAKEEMGVDEFLKDAHGVEALRDFLYEPTCNIAGLTAGYQGEGAKTVLPTEASAKLDMRLVYDQDPRRCLKLLREHLSAGGFSDIEVNPLGICEPSHTPADAPIARAAAAAAVEVYGTEPVIYPKHHASGPDYLFSKNLGLHSIWTGCTPAYGNIHAPNEFIGLEDFKLGIRYAAGLIHRFAN